ncbi:hypothetical protein [Sphingobacterium sp.]|uniref:hypothetical protein n=1 Tax=Sphingobacterium sp. TaxID=341027 RepID=UPI0031DE33C3
MHRIIGIWIVFLICFTQNSFGQVKDSNYFLEKDNTKVPPQANILPLQNFNFHVQPHQALGTKVVVDSLSVGADNYIIYTFSITKSPHDKEYYSFCNIVVKFMLNDYQFSDIGIQSTDGLKEHIAALIK